jgi:hypothetical protein
LDAELRSIELASIEAAQRAASESVARHPPKFKCANQSMKHTAVENSPSQGTKQAWFSPVHFCVWLGTAVIIFVSDELDRWLHLWIFLLPIVVIPVLVAIGCFVGGVIANVWARRWTRLFSVVAAPLLAIGLLLASRQTGINPDWIRFQLTRGHYADLARHLPGPSPRFAEWSWGGTGGATGANIFYLLVYDEADKPLDRLETPGRERAEWSVRPYGHHFFLVTELYQ